MLQNALKRTLSYSLLCVFTVLSGCAHMNNKPEPSLHAETGQPELYLWPNSNSHSNNEATLSLVVKAGSLQETDAQLGYAHFVEHMAFNGTEAFPKSAIQRRLNELGLSVGSHSNAYTSFDHTAYTLHLNSVDTERLETALELLSEWAYRIEFDAQEVIKERPVIVEEWRQSQPNIGRVSEQLYNHYFSGSRFLERRPIGTPDSISTATGESLAEFYRHWYRPDNMAVIVAGDFDESEVRGLVQRYFPPQPNSEPAAKPRMYSLNTTAIDDFATFTDPYTTRGYVDLAYFTEIELPQTGQDLIEQLKWQAALDILYDRLQQRLVATQGEVSEVDFEWQARAEGVLRVGLSAHLSGDNIEAGVRLLETERQRLLQEGVSQQELDDWRQGLFEYEKPQQDSAGHLVGEMTEHYLMGWPMVGQRTWVKLLEATLPDFTPEEVRQAIAPKFNAEPKIRVVHPHGQQPPSEQDIELWLEDAAVIPSQPTAGSDLSAAVDSADPVAWPIQPTQPGEIVGTRELDGDVTEWTLGNGMTVLYRHSDSAPGKVYYSLNGLGGLNTLPDAEVISARLALPTMAQSGLRDMDGPSLDRWLNSNGMAQRPSFSFFDRSMSGHAPSEQFSVLMRLLHVSLTEGRVDPQVWRHIRKQNQDYLAQLAGHPHRSWTDMVEETLLRDDIALCALTPEELNAITPEAMQSVYDQFFAGAQNYRLAIVGDIDRNTVRQSVLTAIATLPKSADTPADPRWYPATEVSVRRHISGSGERQASVVLRYQVPRERFADTQTNALNLLPAWLDEALMEEVRERQGSTYSIQTSLEGQTLHQQNRTLIIQLATDPDRVSEVVSHLETTLQQLTESGPTEAQIATWRETRINDRHQILSEAKNQAANLAQAPLFNQSIAEVLGLESFDPMTDRDLASTLALFTDPNAIRAELVWLP